MRLLRSFFAAVDKSCDVSKAPLDTSVKLLFKGAEGQHVHCLLKAPSTELEDIVVMTALF